MPNNSPKTKCTSVHIQICSRNNANSVPYFLSSLINNAKSVPYFLSSLINNAKSVPYFSSSSRNKATSGCYFPSSSLNSQFLRRRLMFMTFLCTILVAPPDGVYCGSNDSKRNARYLLTYFDPFQALIIIL